MDRPDYEKMLEDIQADLGNCLLEMEETQKRKADLERAVSIIQVLLGDPKEGAESTGLTDEVRMLFSRHPQVWANAAKVRRGLKNHGFPIENYTQPLAVIHTTLRRLKKQGELDSKVAEGKTEYHWVSEEEEEEE